MLLEYLLFDCELYVEEFDVGYLGWSGLFDVVDLLFLWLCC